MKNILKNFYRKLNKNYQLEFLFKKELSYFNGTKRILDLGCGDGIFLAFGKKRIRIIGVDSNKKNVLLCKKKKLNVVFASVTNLPFNNDSFNGVHCSHLIEHLMPKDAHKMLCEVSRVLKKGGIFVLSTPILWKGFYNDFTHIKPYNPESILRYLVDDGQNKSLSDIKARFEKIDFYWRFRIINFPSRFGYLLANFLYQFGLHSLTRDAYTLVLKKNSMISFTKIMSKIKKKYQPKEFWDSWTEDFIKDRWQTDVHSQHKWFLDKVRLLKPKSILEVGCGFGRNIKFLIENGVKPDSITGVDISSRMIKFARDYISNNRVKLSVIAIENFDERKNFDLVFTHGVLMHIPPNNIEKALDNIIRISKKHLILIEQNYSPPKSDKSSSYTFVHNYKRLLKKDNLDIIEYRSDKKLGLDLIYAKVR